jgi:hypothetical protein
MVTNVWVTIHRNILLVNPALACRYSGSSAFLPCS